MKQPIKQIDGDALGAPAISPPPPALEDAFAAASRLFREKRLEEAERMLRGLLRQRPNDAGAVNLLGRVTLEAGNPTIATAFFRRAVALDPGNAPYHFYLGNGYRTHGRLSDAAAAYRRALEIAPDEPRTLVNLAATLRELGDLDQSLELCRQALARDPDFVLARLNLGVSLLDRGDASAAEQVFVDALPLAPGNANLLVDLSGALLNQGRVTEAIARLREAIHHDPNCAGAWDNLLFALHYDPDLDREDLYQEARAWERWLLGTLDGAMKREHPSFPNSPEPARRLRIGYVSPDLHRHPVGYFLEAVLGAHDKEQVEVFCYSNHRGVDDMTERLHAAADHWRLIVGIRDDLVAEIIRRDQIDILVDLVGHTANNRLGVFAHRPAPVQATWIGYFDTTGLSAIDYLIADRFVCPLGDERLYAERVVRLPNAYLCYSPQRRPDPGSSPSQTNGYVTFGCFNKVTKVNERVVDAWAAMLRDLPGSRLCLKDSVLGDPNVQQRYRNQFAARGVSPDRLSFLGRTPYDDHLAAYREIDLALDPFPFNGGTTTVEALWMGVPVVTLAGDRFVGRMGVTHLNAVGLGDLVAGSVEEYTRIALSLARDSGRLADLRAGLRDRMERSPLCDATRFTRSLEDLYRQMWAGWCEGAGRAAVEGLSAPALTDPVGPLAETAAL